MARLGVSNPSGAWQVHRFGGRRDRQLPERKWLPMELAPCDGAVIFAIDSQQIGHLVWGNYRGFFDISTHEKLTDLYGWRSYRS
jgi:hypothetical protein